MRRLLACSSFAAFLVVVAWSQQCLASAPHSETSFDDPPWFSCDRGCAAVLNNAIALARKSILIKSYRMEPREVLRALAEAKAEGVRVQTVAERGPSLHADSAAAQGSERDPDYAVDRPEVVVIDKRQVITVFFRWTPNHHQSIARLFIIRDPDLARCYMGE
jgi:phosphatidylserine/phosphatidylglycerophosphate/cardiolipin synthase-like enzyme